MLNKRFLMQAAAAAALTLTLAGCGGGGDGGGSSGSAGAGADQGPAADSFLSRVAALIGASSDTAEAQDIGSVQVTTPENTEPIPVS